MLSGLRLFQFIFCAAGDNAFLMLNIIGKHCLDTHLHRASFRNGHHVHAKGDLQIGILIEHRQNRHRVNVALELDDRPQTHAVGFIANIVNAAKLNLAFFAQL